jgi:hypothetical protein
LEGEEGCIEATREAVLGCIVEKNRFEDCLGDVDMLAWTCRIIIAL